MGMYDSIYLIKKCPYCGKMSEMEFQTKDHENGLYGFVKGDVLSPKLNYLDCTASCHSPKCQEIADKWWITHQGIISGFGNCFDCKVELKKGVVTGKIFGIKLDPQHSNKWLNKPNNKKKWANKYKPRISKAWLRDRYLKKKKK